jgi:large subunit ribosomal protein L14e
MPYKRFVEVGRLALVSFGPLANQIAVVVDIVDGSRVFIDLPVSEAARQLISVKRLKLTDILVPFPRGAAPDVVAQALADADALKKWSATKWAEHLTTAQAKANLTDFQRFKYDRLVEKRKSLTKGPPAKGRKKK